MTQSGWGAPCNYTGKQKEAFLQIVRPHLLPAYKKKEEWIVEEVSKIVGFASVKESKASEFTKNRYEKLLKCYGEYVKCVQNIDGETLDWIEMKIMEDRFMRDALKNDSVRLGAKVDKYFSLSALRERVLEANDILMRVLDIVRDRDTAHRPMDMGKRQAIYHLSLLYVEVTSKNIAVNGILQRFIEAAIQPVWRLPQSGVRNYLSELKKMLGTGHSK